MPLYEYQCEKCEQRFERIQKFSDPLVETCPNCDGKVRKLLSSPAFQFKGSGWYITDYAKKSGSTDGASSSSNSGNSESSGSDAKSESASKSESGSKTDTSSSSSKTDKPAAPAPAKATKSE